MTQARPADYWFANTALYIQLNAVGDANYIHANCSTGSMVMCYMKGIDGLGFDNGHNYRRWTLVASPTVFHDNNARYVYIAIPRSTAADANAMVVFPSVQIDIYGKNEDGAQIGSEEYFYIFTQGIISAVESSDSGVLQRSWQQVMDSGSLASDEAIAGGSESSWWIWDAVTDTVKFLKTISKAVITNLTASYAAITQLVLNGSPLNNVATDEGEIPTADNATDAVVTPAYANKHWLSKTKDDTAKGNLLFKKRLTVEGETILKATSKVGEFEKDVQVGIGSKSGMLFNDNGDIIARSLELSESLNVPTIKYNQIEVLSGTRWDSAGKGRVKEIISTDDTYHTCKFVLDQNDGEPGEFKEGDILRGFWHNTSNAAENATSNYDDRKGNIQRAGFMSIYCRVTKVENVYERTVDDETVYIADDSGYVAQEGDVLMTNGLVTVQARQYTEAKTWSPYPERWAVLSVSGSFTDTDRQKFMVYTTSYVARFEGVNTWEWEDGTFKGGWGDLSGFSMLEMDDEGHVSMKTFEGSGFVDENIYYYGTLEQFYRFSDVLSIALSRADGTIAAGEKLTAGFTLKTISGALITSGYTLTITRQSGDATADAEWDAAMAKKYPTGIPAELTFEFADVPEAGAVFVVAASRDVTSPTGETMKYTTSASFVLTQAFAQEVYMGPWDSETEYTRTTRTYPSVSRHGCKWYLNVASDKGTEPLPYSSVWKMIYGAEDLAIRFYNAAGYLIESAACYPGYVNIYLGPRLFCGNVDITDMTEDSDWAWTRYTGYYGEETDTRSEENKQADAGWPKAHPATRVITLGNDDMPPLWGSDNTLVNFITTVKFEGEEVTNYVGF